METLTVSHGYYSVSLKMAGSKRLLNTNNERAFIISQLQDLLSPRLLVAAVPPYKQLASCIDLLAFSIKPDSIQLLVFAIDKSIINQLASTICNRLTQYQAEYHPTKYPQATEVNLVVKKLKGPHEALAVTVILHLLHPDWEYDRYSSIGFYLHDRRGDWVRIWRLTRMYENNSNTYQQLIEHYLNEPEYKYSRQQKITPGLRAA